MKDGGPAIRSLFVRRIVPLRFTAQVLCALLLNQFLITQPAFSQQMPKLAPGVLKTIPATPLDEETVTGPRPLHAIADKAPGWQPHFSPENETLAALSTHVTFRRAVWQLEFSFKPMRMLVVDLPDGSIQRIWYLLYKVTNTGGYIKSVAEADEFGNDRFRTARGKRTERFFPLFVLRSHEFDKSYADHLIAGAVQRIHAIEIKDPRVQLHDSVSITRVPLKTSSETMDRGVWAVATWPAVERRTDFFSVYVQGLSNAYRWEDGDGKQPLLTFKTLQLNFWRPGDAAFENEKEFRYGLPSLSGDQSGTLSMYGLTEPAEFTWVFLP